MADLRDYIRWRGDLTFGRDPFNLVDNLIFSWLAYVDFSGCVPEISEGGNVTLGRACEKFFDLHSEQQLSADKSFVASAPYVLQECAKQPRFRHIRLGSWQKIYDEETQIQFAAVTFILPDGTWYVAFQGTDDTIIGWKENFNMSFLTPVPGQEKATEYLNALPVPENVRLRIGGHSKGGNLACYGALHADKRVQDKIVHIYDNDGPGFESSKEFTDATKSVSEKIIKIVPQYSIIGFLMENTGRYQIVKSSGVRVMQHDATTWQVIGKDFEYADDLDENAKIWNTAINKWCYSYDRSERKKFVDAVFEVVTASGASTLTDINNAFFKNAGASFRKLADLSPDKRRTVLGTFASLYAEYFKERRFHHITDVVELARSMQNHSEHRGYLSRLEEFLKSPDESAGTDSSGNAEER
ncbi:MAG: Mbeg1-like protein [Lachnospiraceae bacterium]|jgi:WD40 repeat protein